MTRSLLSCPSCGAIVEMPQERMAGPCAYCRAPLVASTAAGATPDLIAPFVLSREQAAERLQRRLASARWAPEALRRGARPERLDGVLVPFTVRDAVARSTWRASVGIEWFQQIGKTRVRNVEWFPTEGGHVAEHVNHLVSASAGLAESEANALEPFDLGSARPFTPEMTAGWLAEVPTLAHDTVSDVARAELLQRELDTIRHFLPGNEARGLHAETELDITPVRLALLPVWVSTFRHQGDTARLLVNGQTGEVVGRVPVSTTKVLIAAGLGLALLIVAAAVARLLAGIASS